MDGSGQLFGRFQFDGNRGQPAQFEGPLGGGNFTAVGALHGAEAEAMPMGTADVGARAGMRAAGGGVFPVAAAQRGAEPGADIPDMRFVRRKEAQAAFGAFRYRVGGPIGEPL